jgi:hypothetical protein
VDPRGTKRDNGPEIITDGGNDQYIPVKLHFLRRVEKDGQDKEGEESNEKAKQDPSYKRQFQKPIFYSPTEIIHHTSLPNLW